jgi:hypothetical protein
LLLTQHLIGTLAQNRQGGGGDNPDGILVGCDPRWIK